MGRMNVDAFGGPRLYPAPKNAPARKHQCMRTVPIDHGQLEIAVEGCSGNGLPIHDKRRLGSPATDVLILVNA